MMILWWEHSEKGVQADGQSEPFIELLGRSLKLIECFHVYQKMVYHICDVDREGFKYDWFHYHATFIAEIRMFPWMRDEFYYGRIIIGSFYMFFFFSIFFFFSGHHNI